MTNNRTFKTSALATAVASCIATGAAYAQESDTGFQLEEIIVTATRRAASIQDIPINIAAVSGAAIERQGLKDMSDLGSSMESRMAVDKAKRSLREAEERLKIVVRWNRQFDSRVEPLAKQVDGFRNLLDGTIPKATAVLARTIEALHAYKDVPAPDGTTQVSGSGEDAGAS